MIYLLLSLAAIIFPSVTFAEHFVVPVMIGQTGAASTFGKAELDGYILAVEEWNTRSCSDDF